MKNNDIPVIKPFIVDNMFYFYDTYTNQILNIPKNHYLEIQLLLKIGIENYLSLNKSEQAYHDIIVLIKSGFMKNGFIKEIRYPKTDFFKDMIDNNISYIQLQVTRDCNFNCRYCSYANDSKTQRSHEHLYMSWDIAKKSVDYLYNHSKEAEKIRISFYGGEPLLNYELIKKVVSYANSIFYSKKISYHLTTNASLLDNEKVLFFVDNNFHLLLSVDGPRKIQNRNRKFAINGNETFNVVTKNALSIKELHPKYFKENIRFNAVILNDEDKFSVLSFFNEIGVNEEAITVGYADMRGIDYTSGKIKISEMSSTFDPNKSRITQYDDPSFRDFKENYNNKKLIQEKWHPNGTCIPGVGRLFISVYGDLYPCEKVCEIKATSIGNIYDDINIDMVNKIANIAKLTENNCKKCWAIRFCSMCVCHCTDIENNTLSSELKTLFCHSEIRMHEDNMKKYVKLNLGDKS